MNLCNIRKNNLFSMLTRLSSNKEKSLEKIAIIIDNPEDIFYFTNFWGEGILLISDTLETKLVVPKLEYSRAIVNSKECNVVSSERGFTMFDSLLHLLDENTFVYFVGNNYKFLKELRNKIRSRNILVNDELVRNLRTIKDKSEIEKIQKASKIVDKLFEIATNEINLSLSEEDIQSTLVYEAMKLGARFPSYQFTSNPLIIASGSNGALPHAETSNKKIKNNDLIVIDITLSYDHYISDATRTFGIGKISKTMKEVYELVRSSQQYAANQINLTNNFADIDFACRNLIRKGGYGDYFIHSTGHGIGLEVHEPPWIRPNVESPIKENMTITIEPGIYIEKKFGVRIEDSICVIKKRTDLEHFDFFSFHKFSKDLIIL